MGSEAAPTGGAVVVGGDYRGLGIVRSLGRRGIPVWVVRDSTDFYAAISRYSRRSMQLPKGEPRKQVEFLVDLSERNGLSSWVLFPTSDQSARVVSQHFDVLADRYLMSIPPWDTYSLGHDKRRTYELAEELGLDYPRSVVVSDARDLERLELSFPVIIKPAYRDELNPLTLDKAWRADDTEELRHRFAEASTIMPEESLILQEFIPGNGETQYSYAALVVQGESVASITAKRLRQYPSDFGRASSFVETVDAPDVVDQGKRVLERLGMTGIAEVEFKRDPRSGSLKLLDLNLRFWGWHTLGGRSGVDFPYLLWKVLQGQQVAHAHAVPGVRWMRFGTDFLVAVGEIARGKLSVGSYIRSFAPPRERAVLAKDDPLPALIEAPALALRVAQRWREENRRDHDR